MATNAAKRRKAATLWVLLALLTAMVVAMVVAVVTFGTTAGAQTAQGVDLNVKKSISPRSVQVGERQTFTIKVTNQGNRRARNVVMRDPLPAAVSFVRASTSRQVPGSCGLNENRTVVCQLGTLRPGRTVTVEIIVRVVAAGTYTNRAFVSCCTSTIGEVDLDPSDNSDAVTGEGIQKGGKVTVCHDGKKTLRIPSAALEAHMNHGDELSACEVVAKEWTGAIDLFWAVDEREGPGLS